MADGSTVIPRMNMIQALNSAMDTMLAKNPDVLVFGEDVGYFGGVFRATEGLQKKFGLHRCFDTPITESGLIGAAIGMGAYGIRPVVEIQFADYIYPAYDQLVSEAARLRYRSVGDFHLPDHRALALRRRHLRRPDAQPERGGPFHPRRRAEGGDPLQSLRRQGPAHLRHRGR